jgi:hypothetical protein
MIETERIKEKLLAGYLAGELDGKGREELLAFCRSDDEFLGRVALLVLTDRMVRFDQAAGSGPEFVDEVVFRLERRFASDSLSCSLAAQLKDAPESQTNPGLISRLGVFVSIFSRRIAILAVLLLIAGVAVNQRIQRASETVAVLEKSVAAVWGGERGQVKEIARFSRGEQVLETGYAELRMDSGVTLVIEGPAHFDLVSPSKVLLHSGNLSARVPEEAIGFQVDTPTARVVDLGTEFCLNVSEDGETEVHVIEGQVEATGNSESLSMELEGNQSQRFSRGRRTESIKRADPTRFMRSLPSISLEPFRYVHWSFDEAEGDVALDSGSGFSRHGYDGKLASLGTDALGPARVNGQFGSGLQFDGADDYVATDFPGIGGGDARTVAFWVKVPKDAPEKNCYAMVSWGSYAGEGTTWQVSWNSVAQDGPIGRLRTGMYHGQIVGAKDLRDDRWHHVAVVMFGDSNADVSTHILFYLDGELESASRKSILKVQTDISGPEARTVMIGRNADIRNPDSRCFKGWIDEVYIVDKALTGEQIERLRRDNRLELPLDSFASREQPVSAELMGRL